ncbi:hypothetical protein [Nonomuraea rubra]|uniref:Uncharacterized protein n=1 Tax=Nonomuraea rubra TaxID=46180 RepID=A0A7X0P6L7_9ACTN|nr:hypothetical protein [Nonomuraea rubra]MBB6556235.1 hypothetical protein [Nonomuraea rubra]
MSTTSSVFEQRLAYRPQVVELFRRTVDPEIQRAANDIAAWQEQVNALQTKIADAKTYIGELRQATRDIEASADLPPLAVTEEIPCRTCGQPVVQRADSSWTHAGRELMEHGDRCTPKDKNSPVAAPTGQNTAAMLLERIETAHDGPNGSRGMES